MSHRAHLHLITVLVAACVAAGCGDDDVGATDGSLAVDATVVDTGVPDSWLFTPTAWRGAMGLSARSSLGTLVPHRFASFIATTQLPANCSEVTMGPCKTLECGSPSLREQNFADGIITIAAPGVATVQLPPVGSYYSGLPYSDGAYPPGTPVTISGGGVFVPPFTGTVAMVSPLEVTSPAMSNGELPVNFDEDLVLQVVAAASDTVVVAIHARTVEAYGAFQRVRCTFPQGGAGGVIIPAAFLRSLLGPNRELEVFSEAATSLTAGPVEIRLETTRQATAPGGAFFAGKLIRQ